MAEERSVRLTFGYQNSTQKRNYTFTDFPTSIASEMKDKILAINESLAASTDGGLAEFFVDDNGNYFIKIENAVYTTVTETPLDLGGN